VSVGSEIVQKNRGTYTEASVRTRIIPHVVRVGEVWKFSIVRGNPAGDGYIRSAARRGRYRNDVAAVRTTWASQRQGLADLDCRRGSDVYATGKHQTVRLKFEMTRIVAVR
jgi:hypothetical protein